MKKFSEIRFYVGYAFGGVCLLAAVTMLVLIL